SRTIERAAEDARAWERGGADAVLVENYGDAPFYPERVPPETVASLAAAARAVRGVVRLPLGVNVLRNDAEAALAVAIASEAAFIRVNVLTHGYLTDQGVLSGRAHDLLRKRRALGTPVSILADLLVKHAVPLAPLDPVLAARDMLERGGADALVVTGPATGSPPEIEPLERLAGALPGAPLFAGSGVTAENISAFLPHVRGIIAGTWCEADGRIREDRVRALAGAIRGASP
ncbi:MAG: BtpA/SgcQ family protein, partial [Candidatus Eisenbacteria bacterium]